MYKRFRIWLHEILNKPFTVDYGFIFGIIIYVLLITVGIPGPYLSTFLEVLFFMLMLRTTWNHWFGFPYDEEKK